MSDDRESDYRDNPRLREIERSNEQADLWEAEQRQVRRRSDERLRVACGCLIAVGVAVVLLIGVCFWIWFVVLPAISKVGPH
jgi:hypothetical protein